MQAVKRLSLYLFLGLLAYMPLHIFLSTWLGTTFGALEFAKAAKDVVLVVGFLAAVVAAGKKGLLRGWLVYLILAYAALTLLLALLKPTETDAEILGVVYNTRFLLFFLYAAVLSRLFDRTELRRAALRAVLAAATVVLFFGVIQYTVLPDDALRHVGYTRGNGVLPAFFIDDKPDLERAMSTLRDPNSFGSYIIIVASLALAALLRKRAPKQLTVGLLALSGLSLLYTFSRSAWLGMAAAALTVIALHYGPRGKEALNKRGKQIGFIAAGLVIVGLASLYTMRNTYLVQNVIFHADESTVLEDPNQLRSRFFRESVEEIVEQPLGHGPGTAGLASIKNESQGVRLTENYYLQIAQESGMVGLVLFLAIVGLVGWQLFHLASRSPGSTLALALFASLVGLSITNLFVHIWSNEAVAYTWWGLAGLSIMKSDKPAKGRR